MSYFLKRLLLIPLTLFMVLLVNFFFVHCIKETSSKVEILSESEWGFLSSYDETFRKHYGLDLPICVNPWPFTSKGRLQKQLELRSKTLREKAPYILTSLKECYEKEESTYVKMLLVSGCISKVLFKDSSYAQTEDLIALEEIAKMNDSKALMDWYKEHADTYQLDLSLKEKIRILFCETKLYHYFKRILLLDFGSLRGNMDQSVAPYVLSYLKKSCILISIPLLITFVGSQILGLFLAYFYQKKIEMWLTFALMVLYAIPLTLVVPLLIEKIAIRFALAPYTKWVLPYIALTYGSIALYTRFNKTLFLHLFNQKYLKVLQAKGLSHMRILLVHVLRHAAVTLVPLFLGSLSYFLSGIVIVENLFEIKGFGFIFYQAIIQKDYHVILFCTLIASLISIFGYFFADFLTYKLDPRTRFDEDAALFKLR